MEHTEEWLNSVVSKALGHETLKPWQLSAIQSLRSGKDVFAIAPTGAGKSTVMQGAVLADRAQGKMSIAIILVPTKSLGNDQAWAVNQLNIPGIKALALHEDALDEANGNRPRRDLFKEIRSGAYSHIFLGPEMIMSPGFDQILKDTKFYEWFRYFGVDEVHLTWEWKLFREKFAEVHRLRNRFKLPVIWLALSATVEPKHEFQSLATSLGFNLSPEKTNFIHLPVDRPTISYSPRFLKYSASDDQREFPDLAFLIPRSLTRIEDIPITVVFGGVIKQVTRIATYLRRLLPANIDPQIRREVVVPFNGTLSAVQNNKAIEALRSGKKTRILTSTTAGALGIDVRNVERVVILVEKETSYRMICQKIGRIRTSGQAIVYFQRWMSITRTGSVDTTRRDEVEQVIVDFANATPERCPRAINIEYWGDLHAQENAGEATTVLPSNCCNKHNPNLDAGDLEEVEGRAKDMKANKSVQDRPLRSDGTHPVPDKIVMQPIARELVHTWRREQLEEMIGYDPHLPFSAVIPDNLIDTLVEKLHICSTFERFEYLMKDWSRLDELGGSLYDLVENIWETYESEEGSKAIERIKAQRNTAPEVETNPLAHTQAVESSEVTQGGHVIAPLDSAVPPVIQSSTRKPSTRSSNSRGLRKRGGKKLNK
ncbi:DEAD/DEAH-box helicase [Rhizoctonia solani AG-3 Rhs1AP]|uniref:DNA 3'-5' helicase n=1 Tax=Rhizoctonia solani AG-3 Rhs1AP TaxID=1086054 RepID=X8JFJ3_9AGAM|nr:DEAD/DEAH-box helicase [Rhizoctonia solani AG-3 Rhs1AP]